MEQVQKDETGYCVVCGRDSLFRFDPTIITPQLKEAWASVVTSKPANGGQVKTGQRIEPETTFFYLFAS